MIYYVVRGDSHRFGKTLGELFAKSADGLNPIVCEISIVRNLFFIIFFLELVARDSFSITLNSKQQLFYHTKFSFYLWNIFIHLHFIKKN